MKVIGSLRELEDDSRVVCLVGVKSDLGLSREEIHDLLMSLDFKMEKKDLQELEIVPQEDK